MHGTPLEPDHAQHPNGHGPRLRAIASRGPTAFVMPDAWGAGSAQILAQLEDATGDPSHPIYDFNAAVERVAAAVEAARARSSSR